MTGAFPASPHGKFSYGFVAFAGLLFGSAFVFGTLDATAYIGLRLARTAIAGVFLMAAYQAVERLWRPEFALRRSSRLSAAHQTLHQASLAALWVSVLALVAGCGLRWFGTPGWRDTAQDLQFLFAVFFCAAYCVADWNGETLLSF